MPDRVPVTVLTGFLGAGKTTLLNLILSQRHGHRIAVIENEFGEIGIDHDLVVGADEEIFEMNNGCICCTVRGDLIRILGTLLKRRDRFDRILVETTGMADPGPVAQTFLVDPDLAAATVLDGIVTVVDAAHLARHLDDGSDECRSQIAFADAIILNKCDALAPAEIDAAERRVRAINAVARLDRAVRCQVDLGPILDLGGFDLERALAARPGFLEAERGYEWLGVLDHPGGERPLLVRPGPDPSLAIALVPLAEAAAAEDAATRAFLNRPRDATGDRFRPGPVPSAFAVDAPRRLILEAAPGLYALAFQHDPDEFAVDLSGLDPRLVRRFAASHEHDDRVASVGLRHDGSVDGRRFEAWISTLLRDRGQDLYRSKGILSLDGADRRYVFHAVHMLMEGRFDRPWDAGPRCSRLVFIGRDLDRAELERGFAACHA